METAPFKIGIPSPWGIWDGGQYVMDIKPIEDFYKDLEAQVWAKLPPQLRGISEDIKRMEKDNPQEARILLIQYPEIQYARTVIDTEKRLWLFRNPNIAS